jgi:hypothetical protein
MMHRVMIEFVVDVPNADVAKDVQTRLGREQLPRLCEVLTSVMGYEPLVAPGKSGLFVAAEPVTWSAAEQDWIGEGEDDDDD